MISKLQKTYGILPTPKQQSRGEANECPPASRHTIPVMAASFGKEPMRYEGLNKFGCLKFQI